MNNEARNLFLIGIITLAIFVGGVWFLGQGSEQESSSSVSQAETVDTKLLIRNDSHKLAGKNSKVTLVEFSDLQCPACASAYLSVKKLLQKDGNDITIVYRHFPLQTIHKNSLIAAEAAEAAGVQGKFWEMHDILFENQKEWAQSDDPMQFFSQYAQKLELDRDKFTTDVKNNASDKKIAADQSDGNKLGITGTPTFYLNDHKVVITTSFDELIQQVEEAIAK